MNLKPVKKQIEEEREMMTVMNPQLSGMNKTLLKQKFDVQTSNGMGKSKRQVGQLKIGG